MKIPIANTSVAVIISAYNAASTVARAVQSALAEREAAEVIVVDDASTDDTARAAVSVDDGSTRLKIIRLTGNVGPSIARNRAIKESSSPWIGILDADDFFLPGRLNFLLKLSDRADLVADDVGQVYEDNVNGPRRSLLGTCYTEARKIFFSDFVNSNLTDDKRHRGELGFIKPILRREFLNTHNLHYQEHMRLGEDYELYARALANGARLYLIPHQGYVSVVRPTSISGQHTEIDLLNLRNCDLALSKLPGLDSQGTAALRRHYLSVDCRLQWRFLINAVKEKNIKAAIKTFIRPWPVPLYLLRQLKMEFLFRLSARLKRKN